MESILVNPKSKSEFDLLISLFHKMNINNKVFSTEEKEDLALSFFIRQADREKKVSKLEVLKKLR